MDQHVDAASRNKLVWSTDGTRRPQRVKQETMVI